MSLDRFRWIAVLLAVIWGLMGANLLLGYGLNAWFGLIPRQVAGLDGILFMPLLHGSVGHAASNSVPLAVLGGLMAASAPRAVLPASALIILLGGAAVWLFGQTAVHIGASGLIFGWFGFLIARGITEKRPLPILVALAVALAYGTMIWGVLPGQPGVSWEAHLFGAMAGVAAAVVLERG